MGEVILEVMMPTGFACVRRYLPGDSVWLGRDLAGGFASIDLGPEVTLSHRSVLLEFGISGVRVYGNQLKGSVRVLRSDGTTAATLRRGEAASTALPVTVEIVNGRGLLARLKVGSRSTASHGGVGGTSGTQPAWEVYLILGDAEDARWMTSAALAAVLTRRERKRHALAVVQRKQLSAALRVWLGLPTLSPGQVSTWLSQAFRNLDLAEEGERVQLLGDYVLGSGLLSRIDLDRIDAELEKRGLPGQ